MALVAGIVLVVLVAVFLLADAALLARILRYAGPAVIGGAGLAALFFGRAALGGTLVSLALGWFAAARRTGGISRPPPLRSTVRTASLEMELDHDTGRLEGHVLVGSFEGRVLGEMQLGELIALGRELRGDGESRQLLETYLDSRFPGWREDPQADLGDGLGSAPGSGAMTEQEAYQILGLQPGATVAEIRQAHRRLMQRVHPDLGGTSFLAARINQAKDVLLSAHD